MVKQELGALIMTGSILLAPASGMALVSTNTIDQLTSQSTSGLNLPPQELSPLEKFRIANEAYQTFFAENLKQTDEHLSKYSVDWISKLTDKLMQAEAYHQYAFTSYSKVITSIIQNCNQETGGGPFCQSLFLINSKLDGMGSNRLVPADYEKLITDAKLFSDRALELNPNPPQRYQKLNETISDAVERLSIQKQK